jgi:hypothetical protein
VIQLMNHSPPQPVTQLIERVVGPIVCGIVSSLVANWIGMHWLELDKLPRLLLAAGIGLATAITILFSLRARDRVRGTRVVDGIRSRGQISIRDVDAILDNDGDSRVVTDIKTHSGDVDISGIRVEKPAK